MVVWLRTELVLRHIRDWLVSARTSLAVSPHAIDVLGITRSSVHFIAECCAPSRLHWHDKLGIADARGLWDFQGEGPERGVLEQRFEHVRALLDARSDK